MIKAVINVPAARQQVFSVLTDYPGYKNWVPGCSACTVTSQSGNSADAEIVVSSMKRIEMSLRFEAQPPPEPSPSSEQSKPAEDPMQQLRKAGAQYREAGFTERGVGVRLISEPLLAVLLILTGIGYLGQKRVMGRILGTVYAIVSLAATGLLYYFGPRAGWGILLMVGAIYPLLTLILLNTTFREDFTR